jgi:hypothetical protein
MKSRLLVGAAITACLLGFSGAYAAPPQITPPKAVLGQEVGADYFLADYTQTAAYFKKVAAESDRAKLVDIGPTAEARRQHMMIVSSPENIRNLAKYQAIAARLARAKDLTDDQARALAKEGKSVVWIDGGQHAAESEHAQALIQSVYDFLSSDDPEILQILDKTIVLFGHANPDGQELVADWYMRIPVPEQRPIYGTSGGALPRLYQKYIGHDNNRDFYAVTQPETENISRVLFREWYPQIIYNHHQPGPDGMIIFMPPFRDPFNFNYDPLVISQLSEVGATMHSRLIAEGKPGSGMRSTATYSTWFNGSLRTVSYFHNSIGILTEIIGNPTPFQLALTPENQLPRNDLPMPVKPQMWHMKQSIEYSTSLNRAVALYAAKNSEQLLFNIYRMGANAIAEGQRDSWTVTPRRIEALKAAAKDGAPGVRGLNPQGAETGIDVGLYGKVLNDPALRDARGYILSADQPDFPTAVKFANSLIKSGVVVHRATAAFEVGGKRYPAGSLIVRTDQAYRPHVLDMFEPQDHPHDLQYPGGPPVTPYDATGYTLAFQMGVKFDRVLEAFDGPFEPNANLLTPPQGRVIGQGQAGYLIDHQVNDAFILTNRLIKAGAPVYWAKGGAEIEGGPQLGAGAIWVPASRAARPILDKAARDLGFDIYAVDAVPTGERIRLKPVRVAVVDLWSGLMPAGWIRWLFEKFEFDYTLVRPQRLDAGNLNKDYDVIIFSDAAYVAPTAASRNRRPIQQPKASEVPAEFRSWLGVVSQDKTVPKIADFVRKGGTLITIGSSTGMAQDLKLPVSDALVDGDGKPLPRTKFYVPGSVLRAEFDPANPVAYGMSPQADVYYDNSPVFRIAPGAAGASRVGWFGQADPLRSGWGQGQAALNGSVAVADLSLGKGKVFLMGPEVVQRGQAHGAFKLLFNSVLYGPVAGDR